MSAGRGPNRLLAAVMAEAGVSNKGLAARVRARAAQDGHSVSSDHVSVRRWLGGSVPRGRTSEYVALVLGAKVGRRVTPADLGLAADPDADILPEVATGGSCDAVEVSQRAWREVRKYLVRHGTMLASRAVELYEPSWRLPQAPLLTRGCWLPDVPIAVEDIELGWESSPPRPVVVGQEPEVRRLLPLRTRLQTFPNYSSAIRYVSPPGLFENRPCYRLLGVSLSSPTEARLRFGQSCYFDKIDMGEALAHELSWAVINATPTWPELPFRSLVSDPFDLAFRTVNTSINTLTIRYDRASGEASFFLLRRDPAKVVVGGGEYGLVPAGEFQPASVSPDSVLPDLSMWRNIVREYSEELLGRPEHDGSSGRPLDYERWPFFRAMEHARERGELRVYVLGVALCAVSLNATVMTVVVIDSAVFDSLFRELAHRNAEGEVVACLGDGKERSGLAFDEATVNHLLQVKHMMSTHTKAGLSLAWRHRAALLEGLHTRSAAVSNVTNRPQQLTHAGAMPSSDVARAGTTPLLLRDVDLLVVPDGHQTMASCAALAGQAQADRSAKVLASLAFLGGTAAGAPAEGDDQIGDQLANLLCGWVGMMNRNRRELFQLLGWTVATISASLAASGLDTDEQQRLARAIASPSRVDAHVIDHIEAMHRYCKRQDDALGASAALPTALAQRNLVQGLLDECPAVLRPRLLSVYSDMSTSIGYYFYDLDDFDRARYYCDQGRAAAYDAGNVEFSIYALCEMSDHASWHGKGSAAIDLAAAAQSLGSKAEDPLMRVCVAQRAASAYAVDGQYKACMIECEKAENGLSSAGQAPAGIAELLYFLNEGYLARMKSECLLLLGKPQEAAINASVALALYDKSFVDGYTQCTLNLGNARLQCGEIEEAAQAIGDAAGLAVQTRSARLVRELRTTRARMQPWQDTHAVKELDDRFAAYGLPPNSAP